MSRPATFDDINDPLSDAYWERGPGKDRDPQRKYSANGSREAGDDETVSGLDLEIKRLALLCEAALILRGCTLHTKNGKFWVGLPAKPYTGNDGGQTWAAALSAYERVLVAV
jgi:hypothetical protein